MRSSSITLRLQGSDRLTNLTRVRHQLSLISGILSLLPGCCLAASLPGCCPAGAGAGAGAAWLLSDFPFFSSSSSSLSGLSADPFDTSYPAEVIEVFPPRMKDPPFADDITLVSPSPTSSSCCLLPASPLVTFDSETLLCSSVNRMAGPCRAPASTPRSLRLS